MLPYTHRAGLGVAALLLSSAVLPAVAEEKLPSGRLEFRSSSYGLLVGYSDGLGILTFNDRAYPFSIRGFRGLTLGASSMDALGVVFDLKDIADFPGEYTAFEGNFTFVQGGGSARLKNQRNVIIELQTYQMGAELTLGGGSLTIALREPLPKAEPPPDRLLPPPTEQPEQPVTGKPEAAAEKPPAPAPERTPATRQQWPYLTIPNR